MGSCVPDFSVLTEIRDFEPAAALVHHPQPYRRQLLLMSWAPQNGGRGLPACCGLCREKAIVDDDDERTEAKVFGEKAEYWEKYNLITDKWDADMMQRLNSGLDNLLIFVSLHTTIETQGTARISR